MRTWGQYKITSYCICVWCESGEIGERRSSRFKTVGAVTVGVGGLPVHGTHSHNLVHKEVVEVRSNYKKSYFW